MLKKYRKIFAAIIIFLAAFNLAACENDTGEAEQSPKNEVYKQVKSSNKIIWGVKNDTRLFSIMDIKENRLVGFDIDMARAITKKILGKNGQAELFQVSSKTKIPVLKNGNIDATISSVTITPARKKIVTFSKPYFYAGQSLLVKKGSKVKNIKDLDNNKAVVAAVKGTTAVENIHKFAPKAHVLEYDDYGQAFTALKAGQAVAMSTDNGMLAGIAAENSGYKVVGGTFTHEPYGIAVNKGQTKLANQIDKALTELKKDGTYNRLMKKWFSGIPGFSIKEAEGK